MKLLDNIWQTVVILLLIPLTTVLAGCVIVAATVAMTIIFSVIFVVKMLSQVVCLWQSK